MDVEINNKDLLKLYTTGKSKKYRLPSEILDKFLLRINLIQAAKDIYDIWNDKAARFKKLEGAEIFSMRLNNKYRLEIEIEWENTEKTIGTFIITDITTHYE
jgi:proteic killer suppression protein